MEEPDLTKDGGRDPNVDQAIQLFEFLRQVQLRRTSPPRTLECYRSEGAVLWFADLPEHPAVVRCGAGPDPDEPVLTVDRIASAPVPVPDDDLRYLLSHPLDDPERPPSLVARPVVDDAVADQVPAYGAIDSTQSDPTMPVRFDAWRQEWDAWAERELRDRPVRQLYHELFSISVQAAEHPEEFELVLGVGCLSWTPGYGHRVQRHVLTAPLAITFDDDSGRLTVEPAQSSEPVALELDMLDSELVANPRRVEDLQLSARDLDAHPLHRDIVGTLLRRIVHTIEADGEYVDDLGPTHAGSHAVVALAPAVILRKRSQRGLVHIFETIAAQLRAAGTVPSGILPLVDPNHRPQAESLPADGALVHVDDDPFLPLPVNDTQLRIIKQVDTKAQTLVQGPPGTGKTHTAAALLSHLLARGKRVLVTAQTDRALREVREKLPEAIRPLSVAVVGSSREDMADLRLAVSRIAEAAADHDGDANREMIEHSLDEIDRLRRMRAELNRRLVEVREREVITHEHGGYRGTLAGIAQQHTADAERLGWLDEYVHLSPDAAAPLRDDEVVEWHRYLTDDSIYADEPESRLPLVDVSALPTPDDFATLVAVERDAMSADARHEALKAHPALPAIARLAPGSRAQLQRNIRDVVATADELARRREQWMSQALTDVLHGSGGPWQARAQQIQELADGIAQIVDRLGPSTHVTVSGGEIGPLVALAGSLREYLARGGRVKIRADGTPSLGALTPKVVKLALPLFQRVRVNGFAPVTREAVEAFLGWADGMNRLEALDRAWPGGVHIPPEDTLQERLQWHVSELAQLRRVLALDQRLRDEAEQIAAIGAPRPRWEDRDGVLTFAALVDAATAGESRTAATQPLLRLQDDLDRALDDNAAQPIAQLVEAVRHRDAMRYRSAYARLERLHEVRDLAGRRDSLGARLAAAAPELVHAVRSAGSSDLWAHRFHAFTAAWAWSTTRAWLTQQQDVDVNAVQAAITETEERIRNQVETLAATRAWDHAASPLRLDGRARADLEKYVYLVRRLGKGTGTHAARRRAEVRRAMDQCRGSVPVWIMPLYRIAEQFQVEPDMFDVVVIDEASQAGLEAVFLQYLAPRIVVIGDDRQVSPAAVGVDQHELTSLAAQYLADNPDRDVWQDPQRSLFDEAKMRYGGLITLTEHRRCVPEIIGFSNRVAYEPDGVRLIPVRQYGSDRLEPVKPVFLRDGYTRGSAVKVNPAEVQALADQIEKCLADPRYDGMSFGVISLLGMAQAKAIEHELLKRIPSAEWSPRQLRCGDAADFQGSERDVMFLSMVAAPEPGRPMPALTATMHVQRYNVAASRAKDQMWVFHSVALDALGNPQDMRFQLLDYCYGVERRRHDEDADNAVRTVVPEDVRVEPFDSLFEQRVFNRLLDRGHTVIPQYRAEPYRIDLVVVGPRTRLAVECDGDAWHGQDAYVRDLARQRDLERCGWHFFRIRESEFYSDPAEVLGRLWAALSDLEIHPSGWVAEPEPGQIDDEPINDEPIDGVPIDEEPVPDTDEVAEATPVAPNALDRPMAEYETFGDYVPPVAVASRQQLVEGLVGIVAIEGPVLPTRLQTAYVRASGGRRVGHQIAMTLEAATATAVRQGRLVEDREAGHPPTYRLPDQPLARMRQMGPRTLDQVPPRELASLLRDAAADVGWDDEERLFRHVLDTLGLTRLTTNVATLLRAASKLAATEED